MDVFFHKGFCVYKKGDSPYFVAPHTGPSFETPTSRDDNSDTVASLCWMKRGGTLIASGLSRKMSFGIDFNRNIPPKELAIKSWQDFVTDDNSKELFNFRDAYAFSAINEKDYEKRLETYNKFWETVCLGQKIVFIHRKFSRLKNYPSIIDIMTYGGRGVDKITAQKAIDEANKKYSKFFKEIEKHYKYSILLEETRVVERISKLFGFDLKKMKVEYRKNMQEGLNFIERILGKNILEKLKNNLTSENFLDVAADALNSSGSPRITLESIFKGDKGLETKSKLFGKPLVMEFESNAFLNYWYPDEAADIILDIIKSIEESLEAAR